jgi:hypothetical protein
MFNLLLAQEVLVFLLSFQFSFEIIFSMMRRFKESHKTVMFGWTAVIYTISVLLHIQ